MKKIPTSANSALVKIGDKGRGVEKLRLSNDVFYGWSLRDKGCDCLYCKFLLELTVKVKGTKKNKELKNWSEFKIFKKITVYTVCSV